MNQFRLWLVRKVLFPNTSVVIDVVVGGEHAMLETKHCNVVLYGVDVKRPAIQPSVGISVKGPLS